MPLELPCGRCVGCRLERARSWAVRCMHESQTVIGQSCMVTLTYASDDASLSKRALQLWIKRLRKSIGEPGLKYFACGEYGSRFSRPHYHALLFGQSFSSDRYPWRKSRWGQAYRSPNLEATWTLGHSQIDDFNFRTAQYVARYCLKKVMGDDAVKHYQGRQSEFLLQSKGIGFEWYKKYHSEMYKTDSIISEGHEVRPPRYYDKKLMESDPGFYRLLKFRRRSGGEESADERTYWRLDARERVLKSRLAMSKREMEES